MDTYWSPEPIKGYRVWNIFHDRVEGFFSVWPDPSFAAQCTRPNPATAAPHLDAGCECGIYAAKDLGWLAGHFAGTNGNRVAMGRVELSGRVIEHTDGYRAQRARVVELAVRTRNGVFHFDSRADVEALFANPHEVLSRRPAAFPASTDLADLITD